MNVANLQMQKIEFVEEEMDNLIRGLLVGSFNFGIGSIGQSIWMLHAQRSSVWIALIFH